MRHLTVHIDKVEDDSPWVTGYVGDGTYEFYAKVEDEKHKLGVEKGRVIKLVIRKGEVKDQIDEEEFWKDVVANYDRCWIIKPINAAATEVFYAVLDELEKIPVYKKRIYNGSVIKKVVSKTKSAFNFGA